MKWWRRGVRPKLTGFWLFTRTHICLNEGEFPNLVAMRLRSGWSFYIALWPGFAWSNAGIPPRWDRVETAPERYVREQEYLRTHPERQAR